MSTDRDTTRLVRSWLDEGVTALPDRVLDAVLDQIPTTRQRRRAWPSWRIGGLTVFPRLSAAATAVALLAVVAVTLLPLLVPGGGPKPSPSASSEPTPVTSPTEPVETPLPAGRYSIEGYPVGISFTVPDGWKWCISHRYEAGPCRIHGNGSVQFVLVANVVADTCSPALANPPVGPSVDDLVAALTSLQGFTATEPVGTSVDGYAGKEFTLTATNVRGCDLHTWATSERVNIVALGEASLVRILDVGGTRVVMAGPYPRGAADAEEAIAAMRQVMDSVTFTP